MQQPPQMPSQPGSAESPPPAEAAGPPPGFGDGMQLIIVSAVITLLVVMTAAAVQWLGPWMPLAFYGGLALLFTLAIAFGYCEQDQKRVALFGVALSAVIGAPSAAWMMPDVRASVLELAAPKLPASSLDTALDDPAASVLTQACVIVGSGSDTYLKERAVTALADHPAVADQCVAALQQQAPNRASTMARGFFRHWEEAVAQGQSALACQLAPHVSALDTAGRLQSTRRLTECATTAVDDNLAQCCADALTSRFESPDSYVEALGQPSAVAPQRIQPLFDGMLGHAFDGVDATRRSLAGIEEQLLRTEPVQRWVTALGCYAVGSQPAAGYAQGLGAIAKSQGCGQLGEANARQLGANVWTGVCNELADIQPGEDRMCRAVGRQAVEMSVSQARSLVHAALETREARVLTSSIKDGAARLAELASSNHASARKFAEALSRTNALGRFSSAESRQLARQIRAHQHLFDGGVQKLLEAEHEGVDPNGDYKKLDATYEEIKPYLPENAKRQIDGIRERNEGEREKVDQILGR